MTAIEHAKTTRKEVSPEASRAGARLDEDHVAETNGRMAVCRRCGERTDGPRGGHIPHEQQLVRADEWLKKQAVCARIAGLKNRIDI